uniref:Apple domain-containing protein n=1 Tax=Heligmosomoides polygyrus TaxID=6339 RepID=A0A183GDB3_HELPZ
LFSLTLLFILFVFSEILVLLCPCLFPSSPFITSPWNECLRLCLAARIHGSRCLSAMHIPGDDQCVISDQDQLTRPDLFVENDAHHTFTVNYFRNTCIDPPLEGRLEARLTGFRGGEGILELAQRKGQNPKLLAIMTGLQENRVSGCSRSYPGLQPTYHRGGDTNPMPELPACIATALPSRRPGGGPESAPSPGTREGLDRLSPATQQDNTTIVIHSNTTQHYINGLTALPLLAHRIPIQIYLIPYADMIG